MELKQRIIGWVGLCFAMAISLIIMPLLIGFILKLIILSFKYGFTLI